jgi:hypothetical protein
MDQISHRLAPPEAPVCPAPAVVVAAAVALRINHKQTSLIHNTTLICRVKHSFDKCMK